jgi:hypothetical protein
MTNSDDLKRVSRETADRLSGRGIELTGHESPEELADLWEAVEGFEEAVRSRGGDLMVDEGSPGHVPEPDDPQFALPTRKRHETPAAYLERLAQATDRVRRHRPLE